MSLKATTQKYFSIFVIHAAPLGLFVLLPFIAALSLGYSIITIEQNKHISELSTQIENNLIDIESETAPESFMLKVARGTWYMFKKHEKNIERFWEYQKDLCKYLNSEPDIYMFDEEGKIVTPSKINLKSKFLASKLWNAIDSSYDKRNECAIKYRKQFKKFIGNEFSLGFFLENKNLLTPIIINAKTGYIYWNKQNNDNKKGIIAIFWEVPSFNFRLQEIINRYSNKFTNGFTINENGIISSFLAPKINDKLYYKNIYSNTALIEKNDFIDEKNLLWRYIKLNDINIVAALKSQASNYETYKNLYVNIIVILAITAVTIYYLLEKKQNYNLSIKTKLIALFLISVFTPVMGFTFLGYQYISDMRENLIIEFENESQNILLNIDRELGKSGNVFRDDFRKMVQDYQHYDESEEIRASFAKILNSGNLSAIERRLASNSKIISQIVDNTYFDNINAVTDPFSKCCIDMTLNTHLTDTLDPGLRSVILSPESDMSGFFSRPDNVQDFFCGSSEHFMYWCLTDTPKNGKEYFIVFRLTSNVLRLHMQHRLEQCKTNIKESKFRIFARNDKNEEWFPDKSLAKDLKEISRKVNYMGRPIETIITINNEPQLLLSIKSAKLRGYSFYALYPYKNIEKELNSIIAYIASGILLFVIIAIAIGYRLSETFLYPINSLENGVKAIKERNSEFRIEALQNDEFGDLAQSFNKMIGDLKEMELASYIQEALLPTSMPKINGYDLCFSNTMASGVGGDYFDTFLLDEENLCVIIGDVSGHGVASALVMAIAKATFYHGFNETRNLLELFSELNSVVNTYFSSNNVKKMITLFAAIINIPTGKAIFVDSGHNFPMHITKDGEIKEIQMYGMPIGVMKKLRKQKTDEFTINNGETIVFYTDGIVEATGKTEEQYGYERFKKNLSEMANDSSNHIMNNLLKNYEKWEDGTEADDDVTLFILKRVSS